MTYHVDIQENDMFGANTDLVGRILPSCTESVGIVSHSVQLFI